MPFYAPSEQLRVASLEKIDFDGPSSDEMAMVQDRFVEIIRCGPKATFPFCMEIYDDKNVDEIARFESMTPIKKEIQILGDTHLDGDSDDDDDDGSKEGVYDNKKSNKASNSRDSRNKSIDIDKIEELCSISSEEEEDDHWREEKGGR